MSYDFKFFCLVNQSISNQVCSRLLIDSLRRCVPRYYVWRRIANAKIWTTWYRLEWRFLSHVSKWKFFLSNFTLRTNFVSNADVFVQIIRWFSDDLDDSFQPISFFFNSYKEIQGKPSKLQYGPTYLPKVIEIQWRIWKGVLLRVNRLSIVPTANSQTSVILFEGEKNDKT